MIHKRPYDGEDIYDIACKHPRHWENVDIVPANRGCPVFFSSGDDSTGRNRGDERLSNDSVKTVHECEAGTSGEVCWAESDIIGCDVDSFRGCDLSFFPECFAPPDQLAFLAHVNESCSIEEYPTPKIGPEYQANVPDWCANGNASNGADCSFEERLIGTCVIPMPRLDSLSDHVCQKYEHTEECDCPDHGSVTCNRRHVGEAREVLKIELADNVFEVLGFNEMGETVSKKWTEEEEALFHEVVHMSSAKLGKNFWVQLSEVFPTRKKKELVSYYFNVFMLRKRMEQNRCIPLHIDSDDDGYQILDEDHEDESVLESLTRQHDAATPYQEYQRVVYLDHIKNDVMAHEDHASANVCNSKPMDETEGSIHGEFNN